MDSDSDNQSDTTDQMDESDDLDDLRVLPLPESADIIIRNYNRKSIGLNSFCNRTLSLLRRLFTISAHPIHEPPPLPNNTVSFCTLQNLMTLVSYIYSHITLQITFEPEREFEVAGENSEQFDRDLPPEHLVMKTTKEVKRVNTLKFFFHFDLKVFR